MMSKRKVKRNILTVLTLTSLLISLLSAFAPVLFPQKVNADSNVATWVLCKTEDGKMLYNAATTDLVPYSVRSKSNISKTDSLDGFLNMVLGASGFKFKEVNEKILGRPIRDETQEKDDKDKEPEETDDKKPVKDANATAPRVNPFDRFGVAGLHWSSYSGEWKYYETDGCADQEEASMTNFGAFYPDRKEPKASFNEVSQSKDPRVIQYNKGVFRSWSNAFNSLLTNGLFSITKIIVTFTIALIAFSFSDVTELIGLGASQDGGLVGLFTKLYSGFFTPLMFAVFTLTIIYVLYYGLVKRQLRQAFVNGLGQSLICMFFAFLIAGNPSFWIPLPNRVATYGQAVIISAMGQSTDKTNGLCGTNVGGMQSGSSAIDLNASEATRAKQMAKVSENMKSTMGCRMWEEFLLKPWTRGQFGSEYKDLVVAGSKGAKLKNKNASFVQKADVPLGAGVIEHNLALFQLSTQTEGHAQLSGEKGTATNSDENVPQLIDGLSSDWWRVVDTLSNYNEKEEIITPPGTSEKVTTVVQTADEPLPEWQSWIGNRQHERYSTAILSVIFGGVGSAGPLVFGMLATIYSVGVTLLMALSPIFLLLGMWAGRGHSIFRGWLEALVSTMVKKIVASGLLLVSFAFTISSMNMIDKVGWLKSFVLLLIVTYVLIKNRKRIMNVFSNFNFGGALRPDKMFTDYMSEKTKYADEIGLLGIGAVQGAKTARTAGMSMEEGATIGAGLQMQNTLRKSTFGRNLQMTMNQKSGQLETTCSSCGGEIKNYAFVDDDGNYYCGECASDFGTETELYKVEINSTSTSSGKGQSKDNDTNQTKDTGGYFGTRSYKRRMKEINEQRLLTRNITQEDIDKQKVRQVRNQEYATKNENWLSYSQVSKMMDLRKDEEGNLYWDNNGVLGMVNDNITRLDEDFKTYDDFWMEHGEAAKAPSLPEPLNNYLSSAVVEEAWHAGRYDKVREMYREGWTQWYFDSALSINSLDTETVNATVDAISRIGKSESAPITTNDLVHTENEAPIDIPQSGSQVDVENESSQSTNEAQVQKATAPTQSSESSTVDNVSETISKQEMRDRKELEAQMPYIPKYEGQVEEVEALNELTRSVSESVNTEVLNFYRPKIEDDEAPSNISKETPVESEEPVSPVVIPKVHKERSDDQLISQDDLVSTEEVNSNAQSGKPLEETKVETSPSRVNKDNRKSPKSKKSNDLPIDGKQSILKEIEETNSKNEESDDLPTK